MKQALKIMLCVILAASALLCLLGTLAELGALDARAEAESAYLLRAEDGLVAVFGGSGQGEALTVTDIRVDTLPLRDRQALQSGIPAKDRQELLSLLEDLGS